jgi:dolichol kinase
MFLITFIVAVGVFLAYGGEMGLPPGTVSIITAGIIIAGVATAVEALSIKGSDNITVPLLTALGAWILLAVFLPNVLGSQEIVQQPLF